MIENVTNNSFLAAAFGTIGVSRRPIIQPQSGATHFPVERIDRNAFPQPVDNVQFSVQARRQAGRGDPEIHPPAPALQQPELPRIDEPGASAEATPSASDEMTMEEQDQQRELEKRDQEVRRHEQAHAAAAGSHTRGGPSFEFEIGPDGKQYAVAGAGFLGRTANRTRCCSDRYSEVDRRLPTGGGGFYIPHYARRSITPMGPMGGRRLRSV